jgi:hypothetical protein
LFACFTSKQASRKLSQHELDFGYEARYPFDIESKIDIPQVPVDASQYLHNLQQKLNVVHDQAKQTWFKDKYTIKKEQGNKKTKYHWETKFY